MAAGTLKSRWVETEIERGGMVYLLPLRCRLEARKNRLRTVIETYCHDLKKWQFSHRTNWVGSDNATRLTKKQLDTAAGEVADSLIVSLETGPFHADWLIEDSYVYAPHSS